MPSYTFENKETGEQIIKIMSLSELDDYKANNPHMQQLITHAVGLVDSVRIGKRKPSEGFREVLRKVKKGSGKNNTINDY